MQYLIKQSTVSTYDDLINQETLDMIEDEYDMASNKIEQKEKL